MTRRGFTLTELTALMSLTGLVAAASGLLYLEIRTAGAMVEAQVTLERRAALALEIVGRDLRGGTTPTATQTVGTSLRIRRPDRTVHYGVENGALFREDRGVRRMLTRHIHELSVRAVPGGHIARIQLEQRLRRGRTLTIDRQTFVGRR